MTAQPPSFSSANADFTPALAQLFDDVVADLHIRQPLISQTFGWREPEKQLIQGARFDWVPGDPSGNVGEDLPARFVGKPHVKNLADLGEVFTIYVKGHDTLAPTSERAQYTLVMALYKTLRAALYRCAHGEILVTGLEWNLDKKNLRLGCQIIVTCVLRSPVPDDTATEVSPLHVRLAAILAATAGQSVEITP